MTGVVPLEGQAPEAEPGTPPPEAEGAEVADGSQQSQEGAVDADASQAPTSSTPAPSEPPATPSRAGSLRKKFSFSRKSSSKVKKETALGGSLRKSGSASM